MTKFYTACLFTQLFVALASGAELWLNPNKTVVVKKSGEDFIIQCKIAVRAGDTIEKSPTWSYKGNETSKFEHHVPTDGHTATKNIGDSITNLQILHVQLNDKGVYRCEAQISGRKLELTIKLEVYEAVKLVDVPNVQNPVQGKLAKIKCIVSGVPQPEVQWFKKPISDDGTYLDEVLLQKEVDERYDFEQDGQILLIEDFDTKKDNGLYKCQINQFLSADTKLNNITVFGLVAPEVMPDKPYEEVNENQNIDLNCIVKAGVPPPEFTWFRNGDELKDGEKFSFPEAGKLRLTNATPVDSGSYKCLAKNDIGHANASIRLKVVAKPTIDPIDDQVLILPDQTLLIPCKYDDHDEDATANWISPSETVQKLDYAMAEVKGITMYAVQSADDTLLLNISKGHLSDEGKYQCMVTNRAGPSMKEFYLTVEQVPIISERNPPTKYIRTLDEPVKLFCAADAKPMPTWKWYGPSTEPIQYDSSSTNSAYHLDISSDGKSSTFHISPSEQKHYGNYTCLANNDRGRASEVFEVVKIVKPETPAISVIDVHPNKAELKTVFRDQIRPVSQRPNDVLFKVSLASDVGSNMDWETDGGENIGPFPYNLNGQYFVRQLEPKKEYIIAVKGKNEAGSSEWTTTHAYTTSDAEVPYTPVFKTANYSECDSTCTVEWDTPDDRGSAITHYTVMYGAAKKDTTVASVVAERDYGVDDWHVDRIPSAMHNKISLLNMKPENSYVVRVYAENGIGKSRESDDLIIRTRPERIHDMVTGKGGIGIGPIIAIVIVILLLLLLCIDLCCYYVNACGLLMCVCVNCCGKTPPEKAKVVALEEGKLISEEKKPIKDIEYTEAKGEVNEHTPMIDSDNKEQPKKKDTTV